MPTLSPPLVRQNGNIDLGAPYDLGYVQFILVPCRDIEVVRARYGLGPATRVIDQAPDPISDPDDIRSRYFRVSVPSGQEPAFVVNLAAHPEDFQYVEFRFSNVATVPESGLAVASAIVPTEGPAGTTFVMRICCFDPGTAVTKTFVTPSGRSIVLSDVALSDRTVPARWGGSSTDERGMYTVTVTGQGRASLVRFRIT